MLSVTVFITHIQGFRVERSAIKEFVSKYADKYAIRYRRTSEVDGAEFGLWNES